MISRQKIEYIRSLTHKKGREQLGCFVAEGEKLVFDLLKTRLELMEIYCTSDGFSDHQRLFALDNFTILAEKEMKRISAFKNPSNVLALFRIPEAKKVARDTFEGINLILDGIQDPGNLGTIVRTADWFGISNIFCSNDCADIYNPKCVQSTMGALARVQVYYLDLSELLVQATDLKIPVYGTFMEGENFYNTELEEKALIIFGSEGKGISSDLKKFLTKKISIPTYPAGSSELESLNVAISAAIVCAEFRRRIKH
ncbi:MAG: RNA methyltransferase [Prolixibacteraceae bacterium]